MRKIHVVEQKNLFVRLNRVFGSLVDKVPIISCLQAVDLPCDRDTSIRDAEPNELLVSHFVFQGSFYRMHVAEVDSRHHFTFFADDVDLEQCELIINDKNVVDLVLPLFFDVVLLIHILNIIVVQRVQLESENGAIVWSLKLRCLASEILIFRDNDLDFYQRVA